MNSSIWLTYFEENRRTFIEPDWAAPCPLAPELRARLARSLSHFQLGESGGGRHLFRKAAAQLADDATDQRALELFVAEEAEHASLLQSLVMRFGGRLVEHHWTHLLFRTARRALGLNFEIQVLLIAELVGTAYYHLLARRARDPILDQVCARILADEAQHVAFHLDRLRDLHAALLPAERAVWSLQFQVLFSTALHVAWIDHRDALGAIGTRRREFFTEARAECIGFLDALAARCGETAPGGPTPRLPAWKARPQKTSFFRYGLRS